MPTEPFVLELAREFLEPLSRRSTFRSSRLAVLHDGSTTPVLELLARRKFPSGWSEEQFPFWLDGDRTNETLENVGLATRASTGRSGRQRSALGVPSGTKEYMRRWREANRERVHASQNRYTEKRRNVLAAVEAAAENDPLFSKLVSASSTPPNDDDDA